MKQIRTTEHPSLPARICRAAGSSSAGLLVAALIWVYLAWVSVWTPQAADVLNTTPQGVYGHPVLLVLGGLLCGSMVVVTLRRIPVHLSHLGAWLAHGGTILLVLGGAWYATMHLRGDALFVRGPEGFDPVRHAYVDGSAAAYVGSSTETTLIQTPIPSPGRLDAPRDLSVRLSGGPKNTSLTLVDLLPPVALERIWTDDAPIPIPAARVAITDEMHTQRGLLCNAYEDTTVLTGPGWTMTLRPDANAALLEQLSRPGPIAGAHDRITLLWGDSLAPTLLVRRADRSVSHVAIDANGLATVHTADRQLRFRLLRRFARAQPTLRVDPNGRGTRQRAGVVEISTGGHTQHRLLPMTPYPLSEKPLRAWLPDGRSLDLQLGRAAIDLGASVEITRAEYQAHPGSVIPKDYLCDLRIDTGRGDSRRETLRLNHPVLLGPYQLNQGSWAPTPHNPSTIRLAVTTRPGLGVIWVGLAMLMGGVTWAMLVKPLLRRRRRPCAAG